MTPSRSNRQPRMPSGSPSTGQAYESPARQGYGRRQFTNRRSGRQFTHRPLVGAGVADHHRYAVRVAALDQRHAAVAARLAVHAASGEGTLGPGQVLPPPRAVQMTYWTPTDPSGCGAWWPISRRIRRAPSALLRSAAVGLRSATSRT